MGELIDTVFPLLPGSDPDPAPLEAGSLSRLGRMSKRGKSMRLGTKADS